MTESEKKEAVEALKEAGFTDISYLGERQATPEEIKRATEEDKDKEA